MRPKMTLLSGPQLEIMKVVWRLGNATVRDVYEDLRLRRPIAYTTVMTMMKNMESRGHLKKRPEGRAFIYTATVPEGRMLRKIVGDFIDRVFNGSTEPLLVHLVEERRLSEKDLGKISRMIREKESKR
jgi:BlaI family transcriptional regulator, penicillinase repressor